MHYRCTPEYIVLGEVRKELNNDLVQIHEIQTYIP